MFTPYFSACPKAVQYDLIAAVRGPDDDENEIARALKSIFTFRIRGIVFGWVHPYLTTANVTYTNTPDVQQWLKAHAHWQYHMRLAVQGSLEHPIWDGRARNAITALNMAWSV